MTQQKFRSSFAHAFNGIAFALRTQRNMKLHLIATMLSSGLAYALSISHGEWLALTLCIGLVVVAETLNTAIEETVNLVTSEYNEHAKHAKDTAAGATLLASCTALVVGGVIFLPKILNIIKGHP